MTTTHLISRLPIHALQNKTPFEILYSKLLYEHLKVFGCLAFAYNPHRTTDKFEPRGVPCVSLGYSNTQKGYRLLNMLTKKVFVSGDVKFIEHISPFQKENDLAYMKPMLEALISTLVWPHDVLNKFVNMPHINIKFQLIH